MLWTGFTGRFWSNFEVRMVKFGRSLNQTRRPLSQTTDQTSRQLIKIPSQTSLRPVNLEHCIDGPPPENSSDLERGPGPRSNGDEFSGGPSIVTEIWPLKV